jgi:two-component system NarL family response regulator
MKTKVAIVEDHEKTREYLAALFGGSDGIELLGVFGTGQEALQSLPELLPDVLIVDINLPDMSGIDIIRVMRERAPRMEILVLTIHENREHLFLALQAGATGYLVKGTPSTEIINAVSMLMAGGAPMSPVVARYVIEEFQDVKGARESSALTKREREVLQGVAAGLSEKKLAETLSLSPHTVHTHIKKIYRKLQVNSRAEAVLKARNKGIV